MKQNQEEQHKQAERQKQEEFDVKTQTIGDDYCPLDCITVKGKEHPFLAAYL